MYSSFKRFLIGRPLPTFEERHQRLGKAIGLSVFASDAISSTAYATEEILFVIFPIAAFGSFRYLGWMALLVLGLLVVVATSYRQTIRAYPDGGGSYVVARENLGVVPSLVAAASLLVDYVLTVAVSVSAGVAAVTSAVDGLGRYRVELCIGAIVVLMLANLRGVRESGRLFAVPTYGYVLALSTLVVVGIGRVVLGGLEPIEPSADAVASTGGDLVRSVGLFYLARAFSSGAVALTGIEAISNGVGAFRAPESRNAAKTLVWMASILGMLFMGVSYLAQRLEPVPSHEETVLSQLARHVYGGVGGPYWATQIFTFAILVLAANTAFADFPRVASILARDRFLPRQFANRGDRLVFSNGVVVLSVFATVLIVAFGGNTTRLIPLYAVGVFLAFTLSQTGMVLHHRTERQAGWRRAMVVNAVGASATLVVLLVVMISKFTIGAWIPIVVIPLVMSLLWVTHMHYRRVADLLRVAPGWIPEPRGTTAVVLVSGVHRSSLAAIAFADRLRPDVLVCATVGDEEQAEHLRAEWERFGLTQELVVVDSPFRDLTAPLLRFLDGLRDLHPGNDTLVVLPELVVERWWEQLLHNQSALALKARLLFRRHTIVVSVPLHLGARFGETAPPVGAPGAPPALDEDDALRY